MGSNKQIRRCYFEALLQSIIKTDEATNGLNNNLVQIIGSLNSTAEELYGAYTALDTLRDTLRFLNVGAETLSFNSIRGAGSIDALAAGIEAYTQNFLTEAQQLSLSTTLLQKEFNKLNLAMPVGKDGFTSLINGIDKTTASGQELYGRLIILSESFETVAYRTQSALRPPWPRLEPAEQVHYRFHRPCYRRRPCAAAQERTRQMPGMVGTDTTGTQLIQPQREKQKLEEAAARKQKRLSTARYSLLLTVLTRYRTFVSSKQLLTD